MRRRSGARCSPSAGLTAGSDGKLYGTTAGKAHGVGRGAMRTGSAIVRTFARDATIDLETTPSVTITRLLSDGTRDVSGLPLTLNAECCNNTRTAYFKTAHGSVPIAKVAIHDRGRGTFTFRIEVSQATDHLSIQCPTPTLTTEFVVGGVAVSTQQPWLCLGNRNEYLKLTR